MKSGLKNSTRMMDVVDPWTDPETSAHASSSLLITASIARNSLELQSKSNLLTSTHPLGHGLPHSIYVSELFGFTIETKAKAFQTAIWVQLSSCSGRSRALVGRQSCVNLLHIPTARVRGSIQDPYIACPDRIPNILNCPYGL